MGFVVVRITNHGRAWDDGELTFSLPWQGDGHWLARIDPGGHPIMDNGWFEVVQTGAADGVKLIRWHESHLSIPGGGTETEIRFFVGVAATIETLDVRLELAARGVEGSYDCSVALPRTAPADAENPG